jgi:hypothetical protein
MPHSSDCLQLNPASPPSCLADVRGLRRIGSRWALGCVLLFVLVGPPLARATDVPGGNASGTWTAAGSPYNVLGDITVPAGQDLTLEPGVTVAFQGDYRLTVAGTMHAIGTEADSIRITGSTDWQRIRLENVSEPSAFAYCVISRADRGVHSVDAQVDIAHCRLYGHTTAIEVYGIGDATPPAVNVTACRIHDCQQHGVFVVENSATTIADCEITRCALDGSARGAIQLSNQTTAGSNDPTIAGNWIHHNTWQGITAFDVTGGGRIHPHILANLVEYNYTGVYLLYASGELRDNIVRMNFQGTNPNSGAGIMLYGAATHPVLTGNELTGNFTGLYVVQGATGNLGDLSNVDPSDDGHNHIHANVDPGGNTWSIYSNSTADIMAERSPSTMETTSPPTGSSTSIPFSMRPRCPPCRRRPRCTSLGRRPIRSPMRSRSRCRSTATRHPTIPRWRSSMPPAAACGASGADHSPPAGTRGLGMGRPLAVRVHPPEPTTGGSAAGRSVGRDEFCAYDEALESNDMQSVDGPASSRFETATLLPRRVVA